MTPTTFTLEATGEESKLNAIVELLRPMGIQELVRTGKVAIARGSKTARRRAGGAARQVRRAPSGAAATTESSQDPRVTGFAD